MNHFNTRRYALAGSLVVLLLAAAVAHPTGQQTPPPRTIGGSGEPASVDFLALTRDGQPILDLKTEEVSVRVDGRVRPLKSLRMIPVSGDAGASGVEPPPAPFGTNTATEAGRSIVLVIDDETIKPGNEPPLRNAISQFLTTLAPRDQVALVTVPHGGVKVGLTGDHNRIRQFVQQITGQAPQTESASDAACRTRTTLQALTGTLEILGGNSVGPTTVVLFTSSLMGPRSAGSIAANGRSGVANIGMCEILSDEFMHVSAAAAAARANLYVVQHDPMVAAATVTDTSANVRGSDSTRAGIESLAGVTGGTLLSLAGSAESALSRITRESGAYYVAQFDTEPAERGGGSHQISVRVSRDNVVIKTRPDMLMAKADPASARGSTASPPAMVQDSRSFAELPLRVAGYSARNPSDGKVKIIALLEPTDHGNTLSAASAALFDSAGRLTAQWNAAPGDLGGYPIAAALAAPPGMYRLRVAAIDASGRRGTADYEVTAELMPAGPLKLSAIVLGLSRGAGFMPKLQFTTEPVALAYFEIYGGQQGSRVSIVIEVATSVNGPAFLQIPAATTATSEPDRYEVSAAIPIGGMPARDYVIRAIVNMEGQTEGRVVRTLRKVAQ